MAVRCSIDMPPWIQAAGIPALVKAVATSSAWATVEQNTTVGRPSAYFLQLRITSVFTASVLSIASTSCCSPKSEQVRREARRSRVPAVSMTKARGGTRNPRLTSSRIVILSHTLSKNRRRPLRSDRDGVAVKPASITSGFFSLAASMMALYVGAAR